jgi:hypothetical protein
MTATIHTPVRTLLADTPEFRTFVGASDQSEALARIMVAGVDEGLYTRPFAVIVTSAAHAAGRFASGSRDYHDQSGLVLVMIEDDIDVEDLEDAYIAFGNAVGGILTGMESLAGTAGYPHIRSIVGQRMPQRSDEDEGDDYYQAVLAIEWGF